MKCIEEQEWSRQFMTIHIRFSYSFFLDAGMFLFIYLLIGLLSSLYFLSALPEDLLWIIFTEISRNTDLRLADCDFPPNVKLAQRRLRPSFEGDRSPRSCLSLRDSGRCLGLSLASEAPSPCVHYQRCLHVRAFLPFAITFLSLTIWQIAWGEWGWHFVIVFVKEV